MFHWCRCCSQRRNNLTLNKTIICIATWNMSHQDPSSLRLMNILCYFMSIWGVYWSQQIPVLLFMPSSLITEDISLKLTLFTFYSIVRQRKDKETVKSHSFILMCASFLPLLQLTTWDWTIRAASSQTSPSTDPHCQGDRKNKCLSVSMATLHLAASL